MNAASGRKSPFFVIHAGREIAIGTVDTNNTVNIIQKLVSDDWISSVHLYEATNDDACRFCALTGHNLAMEFTVSIKKAWAILKRSACADKCTLYCSYIRGTQWRNTICFGGNAFGELIIWEVGLNGSTQDVLHRLSGHNVRNSSTRKQIVFIILFS